MAFDLHFAEHNVQSADEIRNAVGQRQVNQLDPGGTGNPASPITTMSPWPSEAISRDSATLSKGVFFMVY
jgi:hypothetical protein